MGGVSDKHWQIYSYLFGVLVVLGFLFTVAAGHQCSHDHHHDHHHHHDVRSEDLRSIKRTEGQRALLPEEIAEEEDLKLMWAQDDEHFHELEHGHYKHKHHGHVELLGFALWTHAMACSLLVSLASLICLILLPLIFIQGKPSKAVVDSLALFGAGAMLGDAFLHQLPHAFGGGDSHSHDHHHGKSGLQHSHSLEDLSIGLSILGGIVVFLIVEKLVRYVEEHSGRKSGGGLGHHHHHHHHKHTDKLQDEDYACENNQETSHDENKEEKELDGPVETASSDKTSERDLLRKRVTSGSAHEKGTDSCAENISNGDIKSVHVKESAKSQSNLVFGYLNLFSDGVHNFTDGMALGSAFLLYGSVGGWSRTLFLLAHELPQEIGDFGILVRSGFSVSKALCFNFLSALVALAGTALALLWGKDPGQSSLIEGFTAGGFMYIALGVVAEMNNGASTIRNTAIQLFSFVLGMGVALCISILE